MGLLDILNGMQNGPRGASQPAPAGKGGMSPIMMALLGLLAYKAVKGGGLGNVLGGGGTRQPVPPNVNTGNSGGLGDLLGGLFGGSSGGLGGMLGGARTGGSAGGGFGGLLGGLLGGAAAGSVLNGGLRNLVQDMDRTGQGATAQSWIGTGANEPIDPNDLAKAAGADAIDELTRQTGMPRDQLLSEMSEQLPEFVNQLTPDGRLPTESEASTWV